MPLPRRLFGPLAVIVFAVAAMGLLTPAPAQAQCYNCRFDFVCVYLDYCRLIEYCEVGGRFGTCTVDSNGVCRTQAFCTLASLEQDLPWENGFALRDALCLSAQSGMQLDPSSEAPVSRES